MKAETDDRVLLTSGCLRTCSMTSSSKCPEYPKKLPAMLYVCLRPSKISVVRGNCERFRSSVRVLSLAAWVPFTQL